jgi:hypothetical protein
MPVYYPMDDVYLNIARGLVKDTSDIHKFGANPSLGNGLANIETIWDGSNLYPWSTWDSGADNLYLASSNSADTSRVIEVQGLDENYNLQIETVTLNASDATTAVATANTYIRVFRMRNVGSTGIAGNVTAKYGTSGGTTVAQITDGNNQTLMCIYTIPAGYKGYLLNFELSSGKNDEIHTKLFIRDFGGVFRLNHQAAFAQIQYNYKYSVPFEINEKADIDLRAYAGSAGVDISGTFNLILMKKPLG